MCIFPSARAERTNVIDLEWDTRLRKDMEKSTMDKVMVRGLKSEVDRYYREFLSKHPNSKGYYYPKYEIHNKRIEHGSPHISYLARPYFNYTVTPASNTKQFGKLCV